LIIPGEWGWRRIKRRKPTWTYSLWNIIYEEKIWDERNAKNDWEYISCRVYFFGFLIMATDEAGGDPSLAAGIIISVAIILLGEYVIEFFKFPEIRDYTVVVTVISFFLGVGIGSLFGGTYSAYWGGLAGIFLSGAIMTIFKSSLENAFPGLYPKPRSNPLKEEDWDEDE
jgi:MFS family permease